ncbi:MAG: hypothetical protein R2824_24470 [Saprospiraceae bacterium]|nr:hypothetical protein [Lewinella sp.]
MSNRQSREDIIRWIFIGIIVLILLMRFLPVFRFLLGILLIVALAGLVGGGIWYLVVKRKKDRVYAASTEGQIARRIAFCEVEMELQEAEIEEIQENIEELEAQLTGGTEIAPQNRRESETLIRAFRSQLELRRSKIAFYEACTHKLEAILHNHRLTSDLEVKKKKLERLRENNFEELAKLETLRSDLEMETLYLDTIDRLSSRIQDTNTVDDAEVLQKELEKMMKEIEH